MNHKPLIPALVAFFAIISAMPARAAEPTWCGEVASIVYAKCTPCHRTGEIAPFTLESYWDAISYGPSIKHAVETREMPPWPPAKGHGTFMGVRSLTDEQISTITQWVDAGMPFGNATQEPKPPTFPTGSQLGTPDLVLTMKDEWKVAANKKDVYRFFVLPTGLLEGRNVAAIEFRPGNAKVVHHVLFFLDTTGTARRLDAADPLPGYAGFGDPGFQTAASFLGWVPGAQQRFYPSQIGARLYVGSDLVIQVHYAPSETEETDRSSVNIFFHPSPNVRQVQEFALSPRDLVAGQSFVIPGNTVRTFTTRFTVPLDVSIIAVAPHMHLLGKTARAYAVTPTNDTIRFIKIDNWDFHWQGGYAFKYPVKVPRGSVLYYEASYDNTLNNKNNPNNPPKLVTWGEGTEDEMLLCYFHWLPYQNGDERINMETNTVSSVDEERVAGTHPWLFSPNPASDYTTAVGSTVSDFSIYDSMGRQVLQCSGSVFNVQSLGQGAYVVRTADGAYAPLIIRR